MVLSRQEMERAIKARLAECSTSCDFLISILGAALYSYRRGTVLFPFPEEFVQHDNPKEKNFTAMEACLDSIPNVEELVSDPGAMSRVAVKAVSLLQWTLCPRNGIGLRHVPCIGKGDQRVPDEVLSKPAMPSHIFEVVYPDESAVDLDNPSTETTVAPESSQTTNGETDESETRARTASGSGTGAAPGPRPSFAQQAREHGTLLAYHGSAMENFHGIIRYGLKNWSGTKLMRTGALYGEGIYLSQDPNVAFGFSKSGKMWRRSVLGDTEDVTCVVVCEILKCGGYKEGTDESNNSDDGIPKTYIVVPNPDDLRVKYVLLYAHQNVHVKRRTETRMWLLIAIYVLVLALVARSKWWWW